MQAKPTPPGGLRLTTATLSLTATLLLVLAQASAQDRKLSEKSPRADPTFALAHGQAIVGSLANTKLLVLTRYGTLSVPFEEIVRVRFHPRLSPQDTRRFHELLAALQDDPEDETTTEIIRSLGAGCYLLIQDALRATENEMLQQVLGEINSTFEQIANAYLDRLDEVMTRRFTIKGHVLQETLTVTRGELNLEIPISDVRHIAYGDLMIRKVFKVGVSHTEGSNRRLDSGFQVKKGQKFTLSPSGSMNWQGKSFGPAGISNHTWNSRKMGALQWRIGKGRWKLLTADFKGKADATGTLQFCVHLTGTATSGEFKVQFEMKKK